MSDDILLRFLNKGLINVRGDDDKLARLRQTAVDLSGTLQDTPAKASPFALVAFDPNVPATDPTILEVGDALRARWQTFVNTFADTPVTVFRAMLLDALIRACAQTDRVAVAFVASARNVLPLMDNDGEQDIWAEVVDDIHRQVEERSETEWATHASIPSPALDSKSLAAFAINVSSTGIDKDRLTEELHAAAGPTTTHPNRGEVNTEGNPYWPHNDPGRWAYEFGVRAAATVADAITHALEHLSVEGQELARIRAETTGAMSEHLSTSLQAFGAATAGVERRTHLLWWKAALFSPSARMSYRDMGVFDAAVLMAFDLHRCVPTFSPASVAAFLRETVIALPTIDNDQQVPIRALVEKTRDTDLLAQLRAETGKIVAAPVGRGPLLRLVCYPDAVPQIDDRGFRELVGVSPDAPLTLPEWSVWMFHELQAARAIAEASAPKRQTIAEASAPKRRTSRKRTRRT